MKRSLGLLLILVTTGGTSLAGSPAPVRQIAENSVAGWNAVLATGRVEEILPLYADKAMVLQPDGVAAKGSGPIRDFWKKLIEQGEYAMDVIDVRAEQNGTLVATLRFSGVKTRATTGRQTLQYRYDGVVYSVLKQQADGCWKAEVQRWNSNRT